MVDEFNDQRGTSSWFVWKGFGVFLRLFEAEMILFDGQLYSTFLR